MIEIFNRFYRNKKVLVTGHTGFVGSWLTATLIELGADVIGYSDRVFRDPSMFTAIGLRKACKHYQDNIESLFGIEDCIKKEEPEIVFHLSAQALVRDSYSHPIKTIGTNVGGTANLLEAIRRTDCVKTLINVTTDKVYENIKEHRPLKETDRLGGDDIYSASKACSEILTNAYKQSFLKHVIIHTARAGNIIGGGDWAKDRIIPDAMRAMHNGTILKIRNPEATRPFQHVLDAVYGYLILGMTNNSTGSTWNFAPTESVKVIDIISNIAFLEYEVESSAIPEKQTLVLDSSKAQKYLRWRCLYNIDRALANTIVWYKKFYGGSDMERFTRKQIYDYMGEIYG